MAQSAEIRHDVGFLSTLPLGSIIAWHRDLLDQQVLSLPPGWVECNGQTLEDPESPFHGHVIPNLNLVDRVGARLGREGGMFLRGGERSGELQNDQVQTHTHQDRGHQHPRNTEGRPERILHTDDAADAAHATVDGAEANSNPVGELTGEGRARLTEPVSSGDFEVRHGTETRPVNMSVIWIMKVRQFTVAVGAGLSPHRAFAAIKFSQEDQDGAERTVELGFVPRVIWVTGQAQVQLPNGVEASGPVTGFADLEDDAKVHAIATVPVLETSGDTQGTVGLHFSDRTRRLGGVVLRSQDRDLEFMANVPQVRKGGFSVRLQILNPEDLRLPERLGLQLNLLCMR